MPLILILKGNAQFEVAGYEDEARAILKKARSPLSSRKPLELKGLGEFAEVHIIRDPREILFVKVVGQEQEVTLAERRVKALEEQKAAQAQAETEAKERQDAELKRRDEIHQAQLESIRRSGPGFRNPGRRR